MSFTSPFRVLYQLNGGACGERDGGLAGGHCLAVNDLVEVPADSGGSGTLYTAGRDSYIHSWKVSGDSMSATYHDTLSHHSHWVNALALCSPSLRERFRGSCLLF